MPKKTVSGSSSASQHEIPKDLSEHIFYGIKLTDEQKEFRDAIWDPKYDAVFCNARAGSGKTLIAVATAMLMREYGLVDEVHYMNAAGTFERSQGLLPGTLEEKSAVYQIPLRQALIRIGYDPQAVVASDTNMMAQKTGTACIFASTDSFIRGINIGDSDNRALLIVEEAQNYTVPALRTVLSRLGANGKAIVIGHDKQCDLKYPQDSGFVRAISLFSKEDWCKVCNLTKNFRSRVSALADEL